MDVLSSQRRQVQFFRHGTGVWQHACAHALLYSVRVQIGQAVPWLIAPEQSLCGVPNLGNHAYAFTTAAGDTVFSGTPGPGVLAHEISHSIDFNAFPQYGSPFSKTPYWTDEYAKDTHTPKAYGRKNWLEDFVVTARVAFYDVNVPGGCKRLPVIGGRFTISTRRTESTLVTLSSREELAASASKIHPGSRRMAALLPSVLSVV